MLTILIALLLAIWPFSNPLRNQSRDWYARRLQHSKQQRLTHRKHKQTWLTDNR